MFEDEDVSMPSFFPSPIPFPGEAPPKSVGWSLPDISVLDRLSLAMIPGDTQVSSIVASLQASQRGPEDVKFFARSLAAGIEGVGVEG